MDLGPQGPTGPLGPPRSPLGAPRGPKGPLGPPKGPLGCPKGPLGLPQGAPWGPQGALWGAQGPLGPLGPQIHCYGSRKKMETLPENQLFGIFPKSAISKKSFIFCAAPSAMDLGGPWGPKKPLGAPKGLLGGPKWPLGAPQGAQGDPWGPTIITFAGGCRTLSAVDFQKTSYTG